MHARTSRLFVAALAAISLGAVGVAGTASAGEQNAAPLTVVKTVSGPVPAGTVFTVVVNCGNGAVLDGSDPSIATMQFDATGQPLTPDTVTFADGPGSCSVTETVNGGAASTTYACEGTIPEEPEEPSTTVGPVSRDFRAQQEEPEAPVCPASGPQAAPIAVNILDPDQSATVTIANTFAAATPQPAAQILARPLFTG